MGRHPREGRRHREAGARLPRPRLVAPLSAFVLGETSWEAVRDALVGLGWRRDRASVGEAEPRIAGFVRPGRAERLDTGRIVYTFNPASGLRVLTFHGSAASAVEEVGAVVPLVGTWTP